MRRPGRIWGQRLIGIVAGALVGAAAALSLDFGISVGLERETAKAVAPSVTGYPPAQPEAQTASDPNVEIMHLILVRVRHLMVRGELREAERLLSAAEMLTPGHPRLADAWRLLDVMKARIDLANMAPAAGPAGRRRGCAATRLPLAGH